MNKFAHIIELSLIRSMYDKEKRHLKQGRLLNKYKVLQVEADKALDKMSMNAVNVPILGEALEALSTRAGWDVKERDIKTLISFSIAMIDSSKNKFDDKITTTLGEIYDYYDRKKKVPELCGIGGLNSADIWEDVKQECF